MNWKERGKEASSSVQLQCASPYSEPTAQSNDSALQALYKALRHTTEAISQLQQILFHLQVRMLLYWYWLIVKYRAEWGKVNRPPVGIRGQLTYITYLFRKSVGVPVPALYLALSFIYTASRSLLRYAATQIASRFSKKITRRLFYFVIHSASCSVKHV